MAAAFFTKISTYPPLSETTIIPAGTDHINFVARLEWGTHGGAIVPWELQLYHKDSAAKGHQDNDWSSVALKRTEESCLDIDGAQQSDEEPWFVAHFELTLPVCDLKSFGSKQSHENFTFRYRATPFAHWHQVEQDNSYRDGSLIIQAPFSPSSTLDHYLQLDPNWKVAQFQNDAKSIVFSLASQSPIEPRAEGQPLQFSSIPVGQTVDYIRWFTVSRYQKMWLGPRQGGENFLLTEPALLLCFLSNQGHHIALVAMSGVDDVQSHFASKNGKTIMIEALNDGKEPAHYQVFGAASPDLETSISLAMESARKVVSASKEVKAYDDEVRALLAKDSKTIKDIPPLNAWYDGLAFCTWNALGVDLSPDRILGSLESLTKNGIYPATLIIDDNWQTIGEYKRSGKDRAEQGMQRFEANDEYFPRGLKDAIHQIRSKNPYLDDVAVWHAIMGYWGGIEAGSELTKHYKACEVNINLWGNPRKFTAIDPTEIGKWYDDFYTFLASCGVSGVKTDVQCQLDMLVDPAARASFSRSYQSAWTAAHLRHFGGRAISCMSMIPQILFHQFLPQTMPKLMLRNSDDFYPEFPNSHPFHVFVNAHNSHFTQHLNALPDWDMFQTQQEYGAFHGAARCLSGGPLYITDKPGQHDIELLKQITGTSAAGRTISLRPDTLGRALYAYNSFADGNVLRIGTAAGPNGILGLFNTSPGDTRHLLSLGDIPLGTPKGKYLVSSYNSKALFGPINSEASKAVGSLLHLSLPVRGWDILTAHPVEVIAGTSFAVLGLMNKMTGSAAISRMMVKPISGGFTATVVLRIIGELGVWFTGIEGKQVRATVAGRKAEVTRSKVPSAQIGEVCVVDVQKVWSETDAEGRKDMKELEVELTVSSE